MRRRGDRDGRRVPRAAAAEGAPPANRAVLRPELRSLLALADARERALALVLLDTGLRLSELASLRVGDVRPDGTLHVLGKRAKERIVPIGSTARRSLVRYLAGGLGVLQLALSGRRFVGAILVALVVAGCSLLRGPIVRIDAGVSPRMAPDQVAAVVLERIHAMERAVGHVAKPAQIVSMTATTAPGVARLEPSAGQGGAPAPGTMWLVRAEGTFSNNRTPPAGEPGFATTGFFVISDADGSVLEFGFP